MHRPGTAVLYALALALAPLRLQCRLQANVKQLQAPPPRAASSRLPRFRSRPLSRLAVAPPAPHRLHHPPLRETSPQCTVASGDGCTVPEVLAYAAWQGAFVDREKMREIFYQAGDCRDGERCLIDVDELRGLLDRSFGAEVDEEDCEAVLWAADADYDGRVSFEEFMFTDLWARTPD